MPFFKVSFYLHRSKFSRKETHTTVFVLVASKPHCVVISLKVWNLDIAYVNSFVVAGSNEIKSVGTPGNFHCMLAKRPVGASVAKSVKTVVRTSPE